VDGEKLHRAAQSLKLILARLAAIKVTLNSVRGCGRQLAVQIVG
jgi:hypothetical protein